MGPGTLTMQAACSASLSPAALGSHQTMWQRKAPGALAMMKAKERTSRPTPMKERNRTRHSHSTASVCRHSAGLSTGTGKGTGRGMGTGLPHLLVGDGERGRGHIDHDGGPVLFAAGGQRRLQCRVDDVHAWDRQVGARGGQGGRGPHSRCGAHPNTSLPPRPPRLTHGLRDRYTAQVADRELLHHLALGHRELHCGHGAGSQRTS